MRSWFIFASLVVHAVAFGGILYFGRQPRERHLQHVAVVTQKRAKKEKPPEEKPPPPPTPKAPPTPPRAAPPAPQPVPAESPKAPSHHFATGLTLGNGPSPGGIAVGTPTSGPAEHGSGPPRSGPEHRENRPPPPKTDEADRCDQPDTKPRPVGTSQVEYSDKARADGVEGRIQVIIKVSDDGSVVSVDVVSGIEASLDAYVLSVIKTWKFTPATHCGRAVTGTLSWAQRFELGD